MFVLPFAALDRDNHSLMKRGLKGRERIGTGTWQLMIAWQVTLTRLGACPLVSLTLTDGRSQSTVGNNNDDALADTVGIEIHIIVTSEKMPACSPGTLIGQWIGTTSVVL